MLRLQDDVADTDSREIMIEPRNLNQTCETYGASDPQPEVRGIESLNRICFCVSLDGNALKHEFETNSETHSVYPLILEKCPHLFAAQPVFVSRFHLDRMAAIIRAAQIVIALPAYREIVLEWAPPVARFDARGAQGVFLSYDFHVTGAGPKLIEINTNAGGALLNAALARAQRSCCPAITGMTTGAVALEALDQTFVTMFLNEWRLARGDRALRRIAIVDDNPQEQYLYPEFILFQQLFLRYGVEAIIADPASLRLSDQTLWHGDNPVDLVYNRLTDFMLEDPAHAALRDAYLDNAVVLTPHPGAHALYANKRNLAVLSDPEHLRSFGVTEDITRTLLSGIPRTEIVSTTDAERLWRDRRKLFFKPAAGFGSRAAYRGDKLTKRVWEQILAGNYIAQALVPPGERVVADHQTRISLKFDVRNYVYDGSVQFIMARLYQGQTTNFRTSGGGFAPVFTDISAASDKVTLNCDASPISP